MKEEKDKKRLLPIKQRNFCKNMVAMDFHITNSAIAAGYSKKTAYSQGSRLLKNVEIQEEIGRLTEEALGLERGQLKYRVLNELKAIAFADISNDINIVTKTEEVPLENNKGEIIPGEFIEKEYQVVEMIDTKDSVQTKAIKSISQDKDGGLKIEYYSKDSALDKLAKYGGLYKDVNVVVDNSDNSVTNVIDYSTLTPEEAKQMFLNKINQDK